MLVTVPGRDYIEINEDNIDLLKSPENKVHLIKLSFKEPTTRLIEKVFKIFPTTNRFIVDNEIKFYNSIFRVINKKYYVENKPNVGLISFFRKNNKVLLSFLSLSEEEKYFILDSILDDTLRNVEVIKISKTDFEKTKDLFKKWNGNVIVFE